jgi:hypothetical protein
MRRLLLWIVIIVVGFGSAFFWGIFIVSSSRLLPAEEQISDANSNDLIAALPVGTYVGSFIPWEQVNENAFGLGDPSGQMPPYQDEDVFETIVFHDQLYLGMEADNSLGARLWRTRAGVAIPNSQQDWEEVAADVEGFPFGVKDTAKVDHIDSLAVFKDRLFVSTANRSGFLSGTSVFSSTDGLKWTAVITDGFGSSLNENFKDMLTFTTGDTDWLCGGTWNDTLGSQFWCTKDGSNWVQKNPDGFGESQYRTVWSAVVMGDYLYVGTNCDQNGALPGGECPGAVFRTNGISGEKDPWEWEKVFTATENQRVMVMGPYRENLFVGYKSYNGTQIFSSSNGELGSFTRVVSDGLDEPQNGLIATDGDAVYNGAFYISVVNSDSGLEIWRTSDGIHWSRVVSDGFGDSQTIGANLTVFNGYLYAWAENYWDGQKVFRSKCPIVEQKIVSGPGVYDFAGVGTVITLTSTDLDRLEVGVYPDAFPLDSQGLSIVKRHFQISSFPATATFTATVTFTYTQQEFDLGNLTTGVEKVYMASREGYETPWSPCPDAQRSYSMSGRSVTCADIHHFSTWAFLGSPYPELKMHQIFLPFSQVVR